MAIRGVWLLTVLMIAIAFTSSCATTKRNKEFDKIGPTNRFDDTVELVFYANMYWDVYELTPQEFQDGKRREISGQEIIDILNRSEWTKTRHWYKFEYLGHIRFGHGPDYAIRIVPQGTAFTVIGMRGSFLISDDDTTRWKCLVFDKCDES